MVFGTRKDTIQKLNLSINLHRQSTLRWISLANEHMFNAYVPSNQLCIEIEIDRISKYYNILTAERWLKWLENFKASIPFQIKPINHEKLLKSIIIIFQFDFCFIKTINHKRFIMFKKMNLPRNKNVKRIFGHLLLKSYKHSFASKTEQNYEFFNSNQRNSNLMTLDLSLKNYTQLMMEFPSENEMTQQFR